MSKRALDLLEEEATRNPPPPAKRSRIVSPTEIWKKGKNAAAATSIDPVLIDMLIDGINEELHAHRALFLGDAPRPCHINFGHIVNKSENGHFLTMPDVRYEGGRNPRAASWLKMIEDPACVYTIVSKLTEAEWPYVAVEGISSSMLSMGIGHHGYTIAVGRANPCRCRDVPEHEHSSSSSSSSDSDDD